MNPAKDIELIHTKFLRRILGVEKSTNLMAIYGELGRFPMSVIRKLNMIRYWIKVIKENETSLVKQVYIMMKRDADLNNSNKKNWASDIKHMLENYGLGDIWLYQFDIRIQSLNNEFSMNLNNHGTLILITLID